MAMTLVRLERPLFGRARGQLLALPSEEADVRIRMGDAKLFSAEVGEKVAKDLSVVKRYVGAAINYRAGQDAAHKAAQELRAAILEEVRRQIVQALTGS
jgi:hypothetical protein